VHNHAADYEYQRKNPTMRSRREGDTHTYVEYEPDSQQGAYWSYRQNTYYDPKSGQTYYKSAFVGRDDFVFERDYTNLIGIYNICVLVFICVFACSEANLKNELKKLKTYKSNTTILAANEPKPADCKEFVFVSAPLTVKDPVSDSEFGVHTDQCYLERHVEVFQWIETRHHDKRQQNQTIEYTSQWGKHVDSSRYRDKRY
jgi:hypothetical protein